MNPTNEHRRKFPRSVGFGLLAAFGASVAVAADKTVDPLTLQLSPGSIALLAGRAGEPVVQERLRAALKDPNERIRAAAVRVSAATRSAGLVPELRQAISVETNADIARELAWGLTAMDPAGEPHLIDAIQKANPDLRTSLLTGFLRGSPRRFVERTSVWLDLRLSHSDWTALFRELAAWSPLDLMSMAPAILREGPDDRWLSLLSVDGSGVNVPESLLREAATQSTSPSIRAATTFHLIQGTRTRPSVAVSLDDAVATDDAIELLARELWRRRRKEQPANVGPALDRLATRRTDLFRLAGKSGIVALARVLDADERKSLAAAINVDTRALERAVEEAVEADRNRFATVPPIDTDALRSATTTRTTGPFPNGLVADVLAVTGCNGISGRLAVAKAEVEPDGLVKRLILQTAEMEPRCQRAADALLRTGLPGPHDRPAAFWVVPTDEDFLSCLAQAVETPRAAKSAGGDGSAEASFPLEAAPPIKEPKRKRHVDPTYPGDARAEGKEGVVILEAVISESGCIRSLEVLKGVSPSVNTAAFLAVSRWTYTPTLLNDKPVPVIMTITVNFALRR